MLGCDLSVFDGDGSYLKSTMVFLRLAAKIAASLQMLAISAPVKPGVSAASLAE